MFLMTVRLLIQTQSNNTNYTLISKNKCNEVKSRKIIKESQLNPTQKQMVSQITLTRNFILIVTNSRNLRF